MNTEQSTALALQDNFKQMSEMHLKMRGSDNPEFKIQFMKTFSDLIFSQSDEMLEKLSKTKPASLMNAVFRATESGASFAKKEISFIPFEIFKKEKKNGADVKTATGEYEALVIFDINFQKQQILKLSNCKRFYTCEIHEGVQVISDMTTGNYSFDGKNDVFKPTVGYYGVFVTTDDQIYDIFMSCAEIIDRAKFSPGFKADNYKKTNNSIHFEKIVVRNLMKIIPRPSEELKSILAYDESSEYTHYEDVTNDGKALEEAKKELSGKKEPVKATEEAAVKVEKKPESTPTEPADSKPSKIQSFF
jgi:hypothetical protein